MSSAKRLEAIQVLRGIAAVSVVIFHLKGVINEEGSIFRQIADALFHTAPAWVDLFFMISGFIMVIVTPQTNQSKLKNALQFFLKRLIRIWPLYAIASGVYMVMYWPFYLPDDAIKHLLASLAFLPYSSVEPPFYGYGYLSPGWSLNYEFYFYWLVSLFLVFFRWPWFYLIGYFILTLVIFPFATQQFSWDPFVAKSYSTLYLHFITNPIIWHFVIGILVGLAYTHSTTKHILTRFASHKIVYISGMGLALWQLLSGIYGGHGPFQWGVGMTILFVTVLFHYEDKNTKFHPFLLELGDLSYSIYLWHLPVFAFVTLLFNEILDLPLYSTGLPAFCLMLLLTYIVSYFSYRWIEVKLYNSILNKLGLKRRH